MRTLVVSFLAASMSLPAGGQVMAPSGARVQDGDAALLAVSHQVSTPRAPTPRSVSLPLRVALGGAGAAAGLFGGALFGANVIYQGGCACEDPGLGEAIIGAAVGTVIISAMAAALPSFGSTCNVLERFGAGLVGGTLGALAGGAIGSAAGGEGVFLGYIAGASAGSGVGASLCK